MAIVCGINKYKECDEAVCNKDKCNEYIDVYTGKDFELEILRDISKIYSMFSIRKIKSHCRKYDSLRYMMGICGHCAQFKGDLDDIFYLAGTIVLLQQHVFKECSMREKIEGYKLINKLHIHMDSKMTKDYRKAFKKYKEDKYR